MDQVVKAPTESSGEFEPAISVVLDRAASFGDPSPLV